MNLTNLLSRWVGHLRGRLTQTADALAELHRAVRERVADVVGTTAADVVREAVRLLLLAPPHTPPPPRWRGPHDAWDADWADDPDGDEMGRRESASRRESDRPARLAAAVAAAWQAALWWLRRAAGRRAAWASLAVGLAAGVGAYALGPAAAAAATALSAVALARRAAAGGDALADLID